MKPLTILNSYHDEIQLTLEIEKEQRISFLDLSVQRDQSGLKFGVYRKPTSTEVYINNKAFNHKPHKLAAFNFMLHKANNIPMNNDEYNAEVEKVLDIVEKNNYEREKK